MNVLAPFNIPILGLRKGVRLFDFEIDDAFFAAFEDSPIQSGAFKVHLDFDKKDNLFELTFHLKGSIATECDRCLANIRLPYEDTQLLTVKISHETHEEEADLIWLTPDTPKLNVARFIYEYICLAMPYNKIYDCHKEKTPPCDQTVLKSLGGFAEDMVNNPEPEDADDEVENNPFKDLKDFFNKN
ncbi:MAG: hypothetical protein RLZZ628_1829 [Bacteroidota bacterium]|jgi:uncharacterized metal-binding protein YceD (DUF177 family)